MSLRVAIAFGLESLGRALLLMQLCSFQCLNCVAQLHQISKKCQEMTLLLLISETVFCCKSPLTQSRIRDAKLAVCQSDSQGQVWCKSLYSLCSCLPSAKKGDVALQLFSLKLIWAELASKSRQATPIHLRYLFLSYSYLLVDITYLLFYIIDYCTPLVKYENSNNTSCATLSTLCKSSFYVQAKNPGCIADNCLGPSKTACWGWEGEVRITEP